MAIAYQTSNSAIAGPGASSLNVSLTLSGSDRVLVAFAEDNGSQTWTATFPVGGSATSLTAIDSDNASGLASKYIIAPDTGTNNLAFSFSGGYLVGIGIAYTGVKQSGFPDNHAIETYPADNGATESISLTPSVADCWVVGAAFVNSNAATSAGSGTTVRQSNSNASGGVGAGDNNAAINPAASTTLNFVSSVAGRAGVILSMAPAATSTFTPTPEMMMMQFASGTV